MPRLKRKHTQGNPQGAQPEKPRLFTPAFKSELGSLSESLLGAERAARILKSLLGKRGVELQTQLENTFQLIARAVSSQKKLDKKVWEKISSILNYIAHFDTELREQLKSIGLINDTQKKKKTFLELLQSSKFAALCAKLMAYSSQQQIEDIVKHTTETFGATSQHRAQQQAYGDWGQFGVMFIELLSELVKVTLVQRGYDVPEPESTSEDRRYFLPPVK